VTPDLADFAPPVPDLVITGGRVIDPARAVDRLADVSVRGGRIVAVGQDLAVGVPRDRVIDATGLLVTPGLIDIHTHVYPGLGDLGVEPDEAGVARGVPVVVDAGTSGTATIGLAHRWLTAARPRTRVLAFVDPCALYLATGDAICHRLGIADDVRNLDLDAAAAVLAAHPDFVVGFKVRAGTAGGPDPRRSPFLAGARAVAGDRPVMVPLGRSPDTPTVDTPALLGALRPGDIVTHAYRGASGLLDASGAPTPALADAVARGVRLDVGHSSTDFRFGEARRLIDAGYPPDTVSTGLDAFAIDHPVGSLHRTMSKLWALGVDLVDVVAMATAHAAAAIGRPHELGTLVPGRPAEVSLLAVGEGPVELSDGHETITAERHLVPVGCVRDGEWIEATAGLPAVPV
jgi:dihydroorotase